MSKIFVEKQLNHTILPNEIIQIIVRDYLYPEKPFKEELKKCIIFYKKIYNIESEMMYESYKHFLDKILILNQNHYNYEIFKDRFYDFKAFTTNIKDCFTFKNKKHRFIDIFHSGERRNRDKLVLNELYKNNHFY